MTIAHPFEAAPDRVMTQLVAGLEIQFGRGAGKALAERFLAAEEADFRWEARHQERWLGAYRDLDDEAAELERIAIAGRLGGKWFVATMIVDGNGNAHGMLGCRPMAGAAAARRALAAAQ